MCYLLIYVFLWSISLLPVYDQEQSVSSTEKLLQQPAHRSPQMADSGQKAGRAGNTRPAARPNKAGNKTLPAVLQGLDRKALRLEPLGQSSRRFFHDSVYVLVPAGKISRKWPVLIKLRVIVADSQRAMAHDYSYRLTIDSLGKARPVANAPGATAYQAGLLVKEEELLARFSRADDTLAQTRETESRATIPPLPLGAEEAKKNSLSRGVVWVFIGLTGLLGLLWISNRFFVISVNVRPAKAAAQGGETQQAGSAASPRESEKAQGLPEAEAGEAPVETLTLATEDLPAPDQDQPAWAPNPDDACRNRYFLAEIMLTAGPRKRYIHEPDSDIDLGEDICGFLSNGEHLLLWLLDGTSDQFCLRHPLDNREYFSSRLLAQSLGNKMRGAFSRLPSTSIEQIIDQAISQVKAEWREALDHLPEEEKEVLKSNIAMNNAPECATTLLVGLLSISGDLTAYRSGDSKMLLYHATLSGEMQYIATSLADKQAESNDRLFFRLFLNAEGTIDIRNNTPKCELIRQQGVHALVLYSDGVGMETERWLKERTCRLETVRQEIIYQLQGTADDKSICFVEIKQA